MIAPDVQPRLWASMGVLAREHGMKVLAVGGTENHAHMLLSLPSTMPIANEVREIKAASSYWMVCTVDCERFEWQEGYGAFSIGKSQMETTIAYIMNQADHHRVRSFEEEFLQTLKKYRMEYEMQYLWG